MDFATFIGKFCYDSSTATEEMVGQVDVRIRRLSDEVDAPGFRGSWTRGRLYFMIFDDESLHWKRARRKWDNSTCDEKKQDASLITDVEVFSDKREMTYLIHIRQHLRPRFWYFTFVACDGFELADRSVRYEVHATNELWGWQKEFSLDHVGLFKVYVVLTACFCLAALLTAWASRWRAAAQDPPLREHPYIQLLTLSYMASSCSCAFFLTHYFIFMRTGFGSMRIRFLAVFAGIVANCTIYLIAILSSCGWAISISVLPNRRCFLGLVTLLGWLTALCELRAEMAVDQSTVLYSYQGSMGVLTLVIKIFLFCWFAFQAKASYDEEGLEKRRQFYKFLGVSLSGWSLNLPVTVLLAFQLAPCYRYKVVTVVDIVARFAGQCLLSWLFCGPLSPITAANTYARDTQLTMDLNFGHLPDGSGRTNDVL